MAKRWARRAILLGVALAMDLALGQTVRAQSKCDKLRYLAAGHVARLQAACAAEAAVQGTTIDPGCLATAAEKLVRKWDRASARGDCSSTTDPAAAQAIVDGFLSALDGALRPPVVQNCCDTGALCFAGPSIDAPGCMFELSGTLGPAGSVCDGASGDCVAPPGSGGPCCSLTSLDLCSAGPGLDPQDCLLAGGLDYPSAVCDGGSCTIP
jgi:hypothetical protein